MSPAFARAETKTETILDESGVIFEWGYVYFVTEKTPAKNTEVEVVITSTESLVFFVSDAGDAENYANGYEIYAYVYYADVTHASLSFNLENKQSYDFAFDNLNDNENDATVSVRITFTYEAQNTWLVWLIGIVAVVGIVAFVSSNKKKTTYTQQAYTQYSSSNQTQTTYSYPESDYPPVSTKYCTYCGASNEDNAQFCTNCGSKLN
ncbi:MAG: zinc ribbon domain-containing protein [Candidatus Heimdallarchaeaceae archaeon]